MTDTLAPGWLMETCHKAHITSMLNHSPIFFEHSRYFKIETPIPQSEAAELYVAMNARFQAWTGKSLADFTPVPNGEC